MTHQAVLEFLVWTGASLGSSSLLWLRRGAREDMNAKMAALRFTMRDVFLKRKQAAVSGVRAGSPSTSASSPDGSAATLGWQALAACEATNHALRETAVDQTEQGARAHLAGQGLIRNLADLTDRYVARTCLATGVPTLAKWLPTVRPRKETLFVVPLLCIVCLLLGVEAQRRRTLSRDAHAGLRAALYTLSKAVQDGIVGGALLSAQVAVDVSKAAVDVAEGQLKHATQLLVGSIMGTFGCTLVALRPRFISRASLDAAMASVLAWQRTEKIRVRTFIDDICPVCREELASCRTVCVLFNEATSCGHGVCPACVDRVLRDQKCPLCTCTVVSYYQQPVETATETRDASIGLRSD